MSTSATQINNVATASNRGGVCTNYAIDSRASSQEFAGYHYCNGACPSTGCGFYCWVAGASSPPPSPPPAPPLPLSQRNTFVFGTYDGGAITINVNVNVPNIRIGIVTYEAMTVVIQGPYAANVVQVVTTGYNAASVTCSGCSVTDRSLRGGNALSSTLADTKGNARMVCFYSGGTASQGGCNTKPQVLHTFAQVFGEAVDYLNCQYGAYAATYSLGGPTPAMSCN